MLMRQILKTNQSQIDWINPSVSERNRWAAPGSNPVHYGCFVFIFVLSRW